MLWADLEWSFSRSRNVQITSGQALRTERITSTSEAATILRAGGLVAFPTETVFGLGVDATNHEAVEKLFRAKGRPSDNPLIVHVAEQADWRLAASTLTPDAEALLKTFAPGPLTVVLPKKASVSPLVTAGLETVGLRIPSHPVASEILQDAQLPVAAPSANRSGRPSCTKWESVLEDLDGRIDAIFCEDAAGIGVESTVVDCSASPPTLLRPGAVTLDQLRDVIPGARELADLHESQTTAAGVRSPGLLHPHYQPKAKVRLVASAGSKVDAGGLATAYCGLQTPDSSGQWVLIAVYETVEDYAAGFYEFLREADRLQAETILVQRSTDQGIGKALLDRQRRAAGET